jgi:solute carrier family 35 protein F1/2
MNQIQAHPTSGVAVDTVVHEDYAPEVGKGGTFVTSENDSPAPVNEVLERDAQTKGRWFQYVRTKQFWITLVLGQGMFPHSPNF